ncbi:flagellar motor switch protein FliN [bacterium]|nr:flagellar motor switch protein FliN [bacterium]
MEKEDKNLEEFENLENTNGENIEESLDTPSSLFEDSNESVFDDTASMFGDSKEMNNDELFEDFPSEETQETLEEIEQEAEENFIPETKEESAQEIAEKITKEIKEAAKEITEEFQEQISKPIEKMPDFLNETEESAKLKEIKPTENYVSTVEDFEEEAEESEKLITVRPVKFQQFEDTPPNRAIKKNLDIMQDVSMHVSVELGRTKSSIREVMEMEQGSIVELEKIAGEQVEVFVNGKLVAKGEVIVIEDKFGVRVTSTSFPKTIQ